MTDTLEQSKQEYLESKAATEPAKRRAQNVAEWVQRLDYKDIDSATTEFTKALLLKTVAGMLAGCREPAARILTTYYAEQGGTPEAGVVGGGYRTTVANAAFTNATFAHSSELEDNEMPNFTSAYWVLPGLFPLAQKQTASGKDLITAAVTAWEVASRYNSAGPGEALMSTHICPPTWFGPLGVAAGAAKLLKLDADRTEHAITMAGSWACGLGQAGCDTHFIESGHTAQMGVQSALLARLGATAELGVIDIKNGLYAPLVANNAIDLSIIDTDLGVAPYRINRACIKKYSACTYAHTSIDALGLIMAEHNLSYDDIESVTSRQGVIGNLAVGITPNPVDLQGSRFSVHYLLAEVMLKGKITDQTFEDLSALDDPRYREAMNKVISTGDHEDFGVHAPGAEVFVTTTSGKTFSQRLDGWLGSPEAPLTTEQIRQVCRPYLETTLGPDAADRVEQLVLTLDTQRDITELMDILTFPHGHRR
ncbi:MmgE/PrpD family protein [Candidatus Mycobacterium wuenschmannii]|uniref:MmgE/PrpD family protein n=1 Tax=Candidatus Mycobacterium wuenschmannii TaxID=3027808 RepID=A0ABY8VYK7_9MYCO|nr:MmgE/PrpD family protein [Candidatus Mycobacterium wuenschmannii]WIM88075.1 MmgE/PrpD family protein [Candidatus Mycobacterium wuenschmannii]